MPFTGQSTVPGTVVTQALCESTQGPGWLPMRATLTYPRPQLWSGGWRTFPGFLAPTPPPLQTSNQTNASVSLIGSP